MKPPSSLPTHPPAAAGREQADQPAGDPEVAPPGFVRCANLYCPVMQKTRLKPPVMEEHSVEFEGRVVGFCCEDCVDAWNAMDDAERRERIRAVMAKK